MSVSKKRVRFSDTPQIREFESDAPDAKRAALDPMEQLEGEISACGLGSSGGSIDAAQASSIRAACRRNQLLAGFEAGLELGEGAEEGEEDCEPEEMFDSVTGVPFEPFHLKQEREDGYFDENGNYVEYRRDEVEDAWADELANVEVDSDWLARVMGGGGRQAAEAAAAGQAPDMSGEEIAALKRRVMDLLLPGENVLQALRRLSAVRQPLGPGGAGAGSEAGAGRISPTGDDPMSHHPRAPRTQAAMPAVVQEKFEQLTELSSVLMDQGVYSVHSMTREQLERSVQEESGNSGGAAAPEADAAAGPPAAPAGSAAGSGGDAGQQLAEQLLATAAAGGAGSCGATNGSSGVADNGEEAAPAVQQAVVADPEADMFADEDLAAAAAGTEAPKATTEVGGRQAVAEQQQQQVAGGFRRDFSGDVAMGDAPPQPQQEGAAADQQQQPVPVAGLTAWAAAAAAAAGIGSGGGGGAEQQLDGFVLDPQSGLLYNSELGCYYDAQKNLFGDSTSGNWFRYDAASGTYTLAS